jgi:hypothetical protein
MYLQVSRQPLCQLELCGLHAFSSLIHVSVSVFLYSMPHTFEGLIVLGFVGSEAVVYVSYLNDLATTGAWETLPVVQTFQSHLLYSWHPVRGAFVAVCVHGGQHSQ